MRTRLLFSMYLIAMASVLSACTNNDQFVPMEYSAGSDEVRSIIIDVRDRSIDVMLSDDGQIHIDYLVSSKEGYDIGLADGCLSMSGTSNKDWTDYIGMKPSAENRKILLRIPEMALDIISLKTTNENIQYKGLPAAGEIRLSSNGGNILFENLDAEASIALDVKNGDIRGSITGGWDDFSIQCNIKKGSCNLPSDKDGGRKVLTVNANNGDVDISFAGR